jgi:hypothetical protein
MGLRQEIEEMVKDESSRAPMLRAALTRDEGIQAGPLQVAVTALTLAKLNHRICLRIVEELDPVANTE